MLEQTRTAVEESRRVAVASRVAGFLHDAESVAPHRSTFTSRFIALATLLSAHRRSASGALPEDLLASYDAAIERELRRLLA